MKKKTLITAANHSKAYLLSHLIGQEREILLADSEFQQLVIPAENSVSYAHELLSLCLNHQIEEVIPLKEKEVSALSEAKILFAEYGIDILIPDLSQGKQLRKLQGNNISENALVENYNEFSKTLLQLGYPNKSLCFGDEKGKGNLILIDDSKKHQSGVWESVKTLPFVSIGKLLNTESFTPINIYVLEEPEIKHLDVFYDGELFNILQNIETTLQDDIKSLLYANQLKGFYQIEVSGAKIIRVKPNMV